MIVVFDKYVMKKYIRRHRTDRFGQYRIFSIYSIVQERSFTQISLIITKSKTSIMTKTVSFLLFIRLVV